MHDKHWTEIEIQALEGVGTFEEAASVAISILGRMHETRQEIVQICGPMSSGGLGSLAENMALFARAIQGAKERDLVVFDQVPFQNAIIKLSNFREGDAHYDMSILEIFYRRIFESGFVHRTLFLPGWETSIGARWEREVCENLGIRVEEYPPDWL